MLENIPRNPIQMQENTTIEILDHNINEDVYIIRKSKNLYFHFDSLLY